MVAGLRRDVPPVRSRSRRPDPVAHRHGPRDPVSQDPEQDRPAEAERPACYLHPDRPALLRCSRCERPICADDAIEAPVGYQ